MLPFSVGFEHVAALHFLSVFAALPAVANFLGAAVGLDFLLFRMEPLSCEERMLDCILIAVFALVPRAG